MGKLVRNTLLVVWVWLMMAGVCLAKQVYLRDGGIVEAQSIRRQGNLIIVQVNRDTVVEFTRSEVDLRRTRLDGGKKPRRAVHKKAHGTVHSPAALKTAGAATNGRQTPASPGAPQAPSAKTTQAVKPGLVPVGKPPVPEAKPAQQAPVAAAKPAQQPTAPVVTPPPAPAVKEVARPEPAAQTPSEPAAPQGKEDLEKVRKEAAEMMAEGVRKKDPELMKKAMELQKSTLPQQPDSPITPGVAAAAGMSMSFLLLVLVVCLLIVVSLWVVFEKCGEAGWKSLIPVYNMYILMLIAGKPGWWVILLFIPMVGTVFYLLAMLALAERFGRGPLIGIGLTFLPMIFFPLLAFGGSKPEEFTFA